MSELATLSRQQWAERIHKRWTEAAEALVAVGQELNAAHAALGVHDFYEMVREDLGRSPRWAQMFMSIGQNEALTKHVSLMPADSLALYKLSRLPADVFTEAVDAGLITRKTGREQAQRLVSDWRAEARNEGGDITPESVQEFISTRRYLPANRQTYLLQPQGPTATARVDMQREEVNRIRTMSSGWLLNDWLDDVTETADDPAAFAALVETHRDALAKVNITAQNLLHDWPLK